jgi:hypothetical protein
MLAELQVYQLLLILKHNIKLHFSTKLLYKIN